jgi:hypothetical protein
MKVTALIPDNIVHDVKHYADGRNLTESLITALNEWISLKKLMDLNSEIEKKPLSFHDDFSAMKTRQTNRS